MVIDTLWGSFENQTSEEEEVITPPKKEEDDNPVPPEDPKKDEDGTDEPKDSKSTDGDDPKDEPKDEPTKKVDEPKADAGKDDEGIVEAFGSIEGLLEEEDLMFLDEEAEYSGDADGFAKMMRDNMEGQKKALELDFSKREAEIRKEYETSNKPGYSDMDTDNEVQAAEMLTEYYTRTGLESSEIEEKLKELKDLDYITKEAKVAKRYLVKEEEKEAKAETKKAAAETEAKQKQVDEYISGLKSEIDTSEEMAGFKMTNKIKGGFKDYIFKVGKDGLTEAQRAGKDPSRRLRLAFLDYMDFNKKDFEIKAKTEVSKDLKKKTSRFTSKGASAKGVPVEPPKEEKFDKGFLDFWGGNNDSE